MSSARRHRVVGSPTTDPSQGPGAGECVIITLTLTSRGSLGTPVLIEVSYSYGTQLALNKCWLDCTGSVFPKPAALPPWPDRCGPSQLGSRCAQRRPAAPGPVLPRRWQTQLQGQSAFAGLGKHLSASRALPQAPWRNPTPSPLSCLQHTEPQGVNSTSSGSGGLPVAGC